MMMTISEAEFFLSHLKETDNVLEWGSGFSTLEISKRVKTLLSIEHDTEWFNKIKNTLPENCRLIHIPAKYEYIPAEHNDGLDDQFFDYINYPLTLNDEKFDLIFIDGRSRVMCTSICNKICKPDTLVFVHDFDDYRLANCDYGKMYDYLEKIDSVETMAKFKVR